ncbi:MAG: two-component system response regulator QseB [Sulfurimonas sp.]|jgi:two-component system response regulator QseB|uniref:response regulator transcription factor n=1 Tax=Sulfurimonas sp. TaxID=2022749 RepID=UPI0039E4631D
MVRILLLEDDTILAATIKELLEYDDYQVLHAKDGKEAAELSYEKKFDLYIFDINVPDINGLELLESLRMANDSTPAIFISALIDLESITKAFSIGADDYIKKPFFPQELLIRVNAKLITKNTNIIYKDLEYNNSTKILKRNGNIIGFGEVQEKLFHTFINNIGQILDKEILLECLEKPSHIALRTAITKLKQTTGLNIKNIRSIGYTLE